MTKRKEAPEASDDSWQREKLPDLVKRTLATYADEKGINHIGGAILPAEEVVYDCLDRLFRVLFPGFVDREPVRDANLSYTLGVIYDSVYRDLSAEIEKALDYRCSIESCEGCDCGRMAREATAALLDRVPEIRETLKTDVQAAYDGDPAAQSFDEIILAYPCLEAIATHRLAHELYKAQIPLVPRMLSERAHGRTGIDIHPGARIGKSFFIDHGTGVVIGETAVIGENVKIYQGVTLGALSFPKDEAGRVRKGFKRHPNIGDGVTIYAGATILGGETTIGDGAVVGGNVWITASVPAGAKVILKAPEQETRPPKKK